MILNFNFAKKKKEFSKKLHLMRYEILMALRMQVKKEQEKEVVSIPVFLEVERRYKALTLASSTDVIKTYISLYKNGLVSGKAL